METSSTGPLPAPLATAARPLSRAAHEVWEKGARLFYNEAAAAGATAEEERVASYGRAVMLLAVQPKTASNLAEAKRRLLAARADNPKDEIGLGALYHLARLAQLHEDKPDLMTARAHYGALATQHGAHLFGQLARLKLALLALYDTDSAATPKERLAEAEGWGAGLVAPAVARDYHWMMHDAVLRFAGDRRRAIHHLLAMERTEAIARDVMRADLYVSLGENARLVGDHTLALANYRRFVEEFPRDHRAGTLRRHIRELEASAQ